MKIAKIVISFTIPFFLLILFASILTTKPYLMISKNKYDYHDNIEFDYDEAAEKIMGYLNYRYDDLQYKFEDGSDAFRQTEIDHMVDVKNLYTNLKLAAVGALLIGVSLSFYMFKKDKNSFIDTYKNIYIGPIFFIMFVGGYIIIDFGAAFTAFHKIFFTNDDWQLYSTDTLILMLPTYFWMVSGLIILVLFSLSLGLIHYFTKKISSKL
jgi:integral membrane protein (TIGR01906 family)